MKHISTVIIGVIILLVLAFWMVTFQVNFHEVAVLTTFGKAEGESAVIRGDTPEAAGVVGNLRFKWPFPIQRRHLYDTRVQTLEDRLEQVQTADKQAIVVQTATNWRISDPLAFYRSLGNEASAANQIRTRVRDSKSVFGDYTMEQLTSTSLAGTQKPTLQGEVEQKIRQKLERDVQAQGYGVTIERVAITRIVLPGPVTPKVFDRMRADRKRQAADAISQGTSASKTIEAVAKSQADRILAFATRRADSLRAEGDQAALQAAEVFKENEQFAIFLTELETYRKSLSNNTIFVFDWKTFGMFRDGAAGVPAAPAAGANRN